MNRFKCPACGGEQEYFTLYNEVKDKAIQFLNDSEEMMFF